MSDDPDTTTAPTEAEVLRALRIQAMKREHGEWEGKLRQTALEMALGSPSSIGPSSEDVVSVAETYLKFLKGE